MRSLYLVFSRVFTIGTLAAFLSACASSVPSNFQYETSVRGEQGFIGRSDKITAAEAILSGGAVTDPAVALRVAFPNADVKVRTWGLRYFGADWTRYQVVLDADIRRDDVTTKCREISTETPVGAPTLRELRDNKGAELQRHLSHLVTACILKAQ